MDQRASAEEGVTESRRPGLNDVHNIYAIEPAAIVVHYVSFGRRDHEANLVSSAADEPLHQVFADRLGALSAPIAHRQQLLGEGERLYPCSIAGCGYEAPHSHASRSCMSSRARVADVCSASARSRARRPMLSSCVDGSSIAANASAVPLQHSISSPGVKNWSSPGQLSLNTGTPHAAASNRRPEGQKPRAAMSARVTFRVSSDAQ